MQDSYRGVFDAYLRIFGRLGLEAVPVEAESGAIGGDVNHEFMVPSAVGEDRFVRCPSCGYAANVEAADAAGGRPGRSRTRAGCRAHGRAPHPRAAGDRRGGGVLRRPGRRAAADLLKSLAVVDDRGRPTARCSCPATARRGCQPGGGCSTTADFAAHPSVVKGYIGPVGQQERRRPGGRRRRGRAGGGPGSSGPTGSTTTPRGRCSAATSPSTSGAPSPRCAAVTPARGAETAVELVRSVEAAHTFQLGLKYSEVMAGAHGGRRGRRRGAASRWAATGWG